MGVRHPANNDLSRPVIQYADDTLIILKATVQDASTLKLLPDQFAEATGLRINFHKSTVVPMHVPEEDIPLAEPCIGQHGPWPPLVHTNF